MRKSGLESMKTRIRLQTAAIAARLAMSLIIILESNFAFDSSRLLHGTGGALGVTNIPGCAVKTLAHSDRESAPGNGGSDSSACESSSAPAQALVMPEWEGLIPEFRHVPIPALAKFLFFARSNISGDSSPEPVEPPPRPA